MNHSSILQIHLNGWRKFIVRWRAFDKDLFSCRCLFFSLSFPSFVRGGASDQKAESRFKATGAPPERPPQSASELESYLGFFIYLWGKKRGRFDEVSRDLLAGVRLWKVAVRGRRQQRGDGLRQGQCQTAAGIIWNNNLTLGIVLLLFWLQTQDWQIYLWNQSEAKKKKMQLKVPVQ